MAMFEGRGVAEPVDRGAAVESVRPGAAAGARPQRFTSETVTGVRWWTPALLSFRTTRAPAFRFTPGHYARLGLDAPGGGIVWRPFSIVSAAYDEHLEFLAVLVPGGEFSTLLAPLREGATMHVEKASYGFMTVDQFAPGRDLWMIASGTGLGPYLSVLRDPHNWQAFERLIVVHSVRNATDLVYRDEIAAMPRGELFADARAKLRYVPVVTREQHPGALSSRIPELAADGRLEEAAGVKLDPAHSRIMVCGNPGLARELRRCFTARGFATNRRAAPGQLAFENYWQGTSP